jgi:hypothetical protein
MNIGIVVLIILAVPTLFQVTMIGSKQRKMYKELIEKSVYLKIRLVPEKKNYKRLSNNKCVRGYAWNPGCEAPWSTMLADMVGSAGD